MSIYRMFLNIQSSSVTEKAGGFRPAKGTGSEEEPHFSNVAWAQNDLCHFVSVGSRLDVSRDGFHFLLFAPNSVNTKFMSPSVSHQRGLLTFLD